MYLNKNFSGLESNTLNKQKMNQSLTRLSTGLKLTKASDDASGIAISDNLRTQASGIKQSIANANNAIAMMNIADKAIKELSNIIDIIKTKALQMSTDTSSNEGKKIIKTDILKLINNYDSIIEQTNYNTKPLLKGCTELVFQIGNKDEFTITADINSIKSCDMGKADPYTLNNFISGFQPMSLATTTIGNASDGVLLVNDLNKTVSYISNPEGRFMIEIPAGIKDLTLFLNEYTQDDTFQIFTKDGKHIAGTAASDFSWTNLKTSPSDIKNPSSIVINNPSYFNPSASYINELSSPSIPNTYHGPFNSLDGNSNSPTSLTTATYTDKNGNLQTITIQENEELITIPNVTEDLVIFVNGVGAYEVSAEWESTPIPSEENSDSCGCEKKPLPRNDDNPKLSTQARQLLSVVDETLNQLNLERGNIGSTTNQLAAANRNLLTAYVNTKNSESIIRDVDYAKESSNFNKLNIIGQANSFAQTQYIQNKKNVLELLN